MESEKVNESEDTTLRIICGQSLAKDRTEEQLTVQKPFVSIIRVKTMYDGPAKLRCDETSQRLGRISRLI